MEPSRKNPVFDGAKGSPGQVMAPDPLPKSFPGQTWGQCQPSQVRYLEGLSVGAPEAPESRWAGTNQRARLPPGIRRVDSHRLAFLEESLP